MKTPYQITQIAILCHELNKKYCELIGDTSQAPWESAPAWQRESACQGVRIHLNNPDLTPEESHRHWMAAKLEQGWKYGPVKDELKKEHPCMVEYKDLPRSQQVKDYIFKAVVDGHRN